MKTILGIAALLAAVILLSWGCAQVPSSDRAERAVENLGLHNVKVVDRSYSWGELGGCHEKNITKFTVVGYTADGVKRTIYVCAPIIGGYTVRN